MFEQIQELAYLKWEAAGYPHGDGVEYWLQAEEELKAKAAKPARKKASSNGEPSRVAAKASVKRK